MKQQINLIGKRFGRLYVIQSAGKINNQTTYLCQCECGNKVTTRGDLLRSGKSKSCGCLATEKLIERRTKYYYSNGNNYSAKQICDICEIAPITMYRYIEEGIDIAWLTKLCSLAANSERKQQIRKEFIKNSKNYNKKSIIDVDDYLDDLNYSYSEPINDYKVSDLW